MSPHNSEQFHNEDPSQQETNRRGPKRWLFLFGRHLGGSEVDAEAELLSRALSHREERDVVLDAFDHVVIEVHNLLDDLRAGTIPQLLRAEFPGAEEFDPELKTIITDIYEGNQENFNVLDNLIEIVNRNRNRISIDRILTFCDDYQLMIDVVRDTLHRRLNGRI